LKGSELFSLPDVLFHECRLIARGNNTYHQPWSLPTEIPGALRQFVDSERYLNFVANFNKTARWSWA
jgi:hypothetical protein